MKFSLQYVYQCNPKLATVNARVSLPRKLATRVHYFQIDLQVEVVCLCSIFLGEDARYLPTDRFF